VLPTCLLLWTSRDATWFLSPNRTARLFVGAKEATNLKKLK